MIADGTIVNADINASAAIDKTKISGTAITAGDTGTVTSTMIADGTIVNADINTSAAIDLGKLADATIDIKTADYTLQLTDKNKFIKMNLTGTANTVTIPSDATVTFPAGSQIHIIQYGTGKTTFAHASGNAFIYRTPGLFLRDRYSSATLLKCAAANTWMLMGDLSAS
jgi:sporulation protein YlmC with PRC-barrel domain